MTEFEKKSRYTVEDLKQIVALLRSENGCPWDREQTHTSIRKNLIEETYEAVEAIDRADPALLREELGDVLLQVMLHAQMEDEAGRFTFDDVANDICQKLIIRHPHVFGDVQVHGVDEVLDNWNSIKQKTKGQTTASETLDAVPRQLPALMRSDKVQSRARKAGFDYPDAAMAMDELKSEVEELTDAMAAGETPAVAEELGDVLFAAVNVSRFYQLDAEELLTRSCDKFIARFKLVERLAEERGIDMKAADIDALNVLWRDAKRCIQEDPIPHEE